MSNLPYETHRSLIETISDGPHLRVIFIKRYLKFISSLKDSEKPILRRLFNLASSTTRSTTGRNMRHILIETKSNDSLELNVDDYNRIQYHPLHEEDIWIGEMVDQMIEAMDDQKHDREDMIWLEYLCTN